MTGLLWFDDSPARTLADKVRAACAAYARKFGEQANVCYVHPDALGTATEAVLAGIPVVARRETLRHHFFAVREDDNGKDNHYDE